MSTLPLTDRCRLPTFAWAVLVACLLPAARVPAVRDPGTTATLFVTAVDASGRLVPNLEPADFLVKQQGRVRPVVAARAVTRPASLVLMLDTGGNTTTTMMRLRLDAADLAKQLMPPSRMRVGFFNEAIRLAGTFTDRPDDVLRALWSDMALDKPSRLFDAGAAAIDALRSEPGRRVVLFMTDGDDTASRTKVQDVIRRAVDEGVEIWSLTYTPQATRGSTRPDPGGVRRLARDTGGYSLDAADGARRHVSVEALARLISTQYELSFASLESGKAQQVEVSAARAGVTLLAPRRAVEGASPILVQTENEKGAGL